LFYCFESLFSKTDRQNSAASLLLQLQITVTVAVLLPLYQ